MSLRVYLECDKCGERFAAVNKQDCTRIEREAVANGWTTTGRKTTGYFARRHKCPACIRSETPEPTPAKLSEPHHAGH